MKKKNSYRLIAFFMLASLLPTGCGTIDQIHTNEVTTNFDEIFILYSKHLRWGHFKELTSFMTAEQIGPAMEIIAANTDKIGDRKVSKVQPLSWLLDEQAGTMTGDVTIEYYIPSRSVIRTATDHQIWKLNGNVWQLDSGLPKLP